MRIRKNASRLLGSASDPLHSPPPPPPAISAADHQDCSNACSSSSSSSYSSVCGLNRSPWDLIDSKVEDHDGGIMGSSIDREVNDEEESPVADAAPIAGKAYSETRALILISSAGAKSDAEIKENREEKIKSCSKRGKGWSCTRPAEPSHGFCSYHLAKLRSSAAGRGSFGKRSAAAVGGSRSGRKERALKKPPPAAPSDSSSYYYYSRFVPWQAKRRGGADVRVDQATGLNSEPGNDDGEDETENAEDSGERAEGVLALRDDNKNEPAELPRSHCGRRPAKDVGVKEATAVARGKSKKRATKKKMAEAASESSFYYYYGGFGPWRSKVRGKPAEAHGSEEKDRIEDEEIVRAGEF